MKKILVRLGIRSRSPGQASRLATGNYLAAALAAAAVAGTAGSASAP